LRYAVRMVKQDGPALDLPTTTHPRTQTRIAEQPAPRGTHRYANQDLKQKGER